MTMISALGTRARRRLAVMAGIVMAATTISLGAATPAQAVIGGDVFRYDSIQNLIIARNIRDYNEGRGGNCAIWNWDGGSTWNYTNPGGNCDTASMNGRTYSWTLWVDTDAFTMQYEDYWVNMHGSWHRVLANTYTKIIDTDDAHCYRLSDGVNCYIFPG